MTPKVHKIQPSSSHLKHKRVMKHVEDLAKKIKQGKYHILFCTLFDWEGGWEKAEWVLNTIQEELIINGAHFIILSFQRYEGSHVMRVTKGHERIGRPRMNVFACFEDKSISSDELVDRLAQKKLHVKKRVSMSRLKRWRDTVLYGIQYCLRNHSHWATRMELIRVGIENNVHAYSIVELPKEVEVILYEMDSIQDFHWKWKRITKEKMQEISERKE